MTPADALASGKCISGRKCHAFLSSERQTGRVLDPIGPSLAASVQVNRFGLAPKGHVPGKWKLIVDLSSPEGHSALVLICAA